MNRDVIQIERIFEELQFIKYTLKDINKDKFLSDNVLQHAISMSLITIGESANHLSENFIDKYPEIEWIQIIAVRNIAAHGYWQLSMDQIWQAVFEDIPKLDNFIEKILDRNKTNTFT
jgi:uncharacterized protein with HEPN domain